MTDKEAREFVLGKLNIVREQNKARAEADRMLAIEREQIRLAQEQERQAEILRKHEEQIQKHEAEIRDMKHRMKQAKRDYDALKQRLENLEELHELISEQLDGCENPKQKETLLRKILTIDSQIASADKRLRQAAHIHTEISRKLSA